jgi:hypothetical protein
VTGAGVTVKNRDDGGLGPMNSEAPFVRIIRALLPGQLVHGFSKTFLKSENDLVCLSPKLLHIRNNLSIGTLKGL